MSDVCDSIGNWLVHEKGCQKDTYTLGYIKNPEIEADRLTSVLGIRWNLANKNALKLPLLSGYVVQVTERDTPENVDETLGKVDGMHWRAQCGQSREWTQGMHEASFYLAGQPEYPSDVLERCKERGIGVLCVQRAANRETDVRECLAPRAMPLSGMSAPTRRSAGLFENAIRANRYLKMVFLRPDAFFDDVIRPERKAYEIQHRTGGV